jgi:hypothetical protein
MYKTIILSLLIIIVINYIIHFLKKTFTEPIIRYIPDSNPMGTGMKKGTEKDEEIDMKTELSTFLMTINI